MSSIPRKFGVLDSHHHNGNLVLSTGVNRNLDDDRSWAELDDAEWQERLQTMNDVGIDAALIMPVNRYIQADGIADTRRVNDAIANYRDRDPERLPAALGIAEPLHGRASFDEIRRIRDELGLVGVSYHGRWQGVGTNDPWILEQLDLLGELRMLPFVHAHAESNLESPSLVGHIARAFPDLPIVVTDGLSTIVQMIHFLDVVEAHDNIYLETSCMAHIGYIHRLIEVMGADRIIFGSDTYSHLMVTINTPDVIRNCGIAPADVEKILSANMLGLLAWTGLHL